MKPAAIYLRVSTDAQENANQRPDCERLCAARGWDPYWFCEIESGATERPIWRRVMEGARKGDFAAVVIWAIDRVGRNRVQVAHDLGELFRWKVNVVSVCDPWIDTAPGPMRDLLVQVLGWIAEGEREHLIARTKAGLARARAEGKTLGRPRVPDQVVTRVLGAHRQLLIGGRTPSPGSIARQLGVPRSTVRDILAKKGGRNGGGNPAEGQDP